jgi:hypothetical protein
MVGAVPMFNDFVVIFKGANYNEGPTTCTLYDGLVLILKDGKIVVLQLAIM